MDAKAIDKSISKNVDSANEQGKVKQFVLTYDIPAGPIPRGVIPDRPMRVKIEFDFDGPGILKPKCMYIHPNQVHGIEGFVKVIVDGLKKKFKCEVHANVEITQDLNEKEMHERDLSPGVNEVPIEY